jgi:hypothetical protein
MTPSGWSAPANNIKLDNSLGYVKDSNLVGGFYTSEPLRALIARLGLGANPPKTVPSPASYRCSLVVASLPCSPKLLPFLASSCSSLPFPSPSFLSQAPGGLPPET